MVHANGEKEMVFSISLGKMTNKPHKHLLTHTVEYNILFPLLYYSISTIYLFSERVTFLQKLCCFLKKYNLNTLSTTNKIVFISTIFE